MTEQENKMLFDIARDIATNLEATKNIEGHLKSLNGKVANHESRLQSLEGGNAVFASNLATLQENKKKVQSFWTEILSRASWALIAMFAIAVYNTWRWLVTSGILTKILNNS